MLFSTCTSLTSGFTRSSSASVRSFGLLAHATASAGARSRRGVRRRRCIAFRPSIRLRLGGAVVAVGEREAGLVELHGEALAAHLELVRGHVLEQLALGLHQVLEASE